MNHLVQKSRFLPWMLLACSSALLSCGDCNFERKRVEAFLADPANQKCTTDADCAVATVNCLGLDDAFCGQVVLSKRANDSLAWRQTRDELADCEDVDACTVCNAELIPTCTNGSCR